MPGMLQPKRRLERLGPDRLRVTVQPIFPTGEPLKTRTLPITEAQWAEWQGGRYIQDAMPHLNEETREWLMSGLDGAAFSRLFPEDAE